MLPELNTNRHSVAYQKFERKREVDRALARKGSQSGRRIVKSWLSPFSLPSAGSIFLPLDWPDSSSRYVIWQSSPYSLSLQSSLG